MLATSQCRNLSSSIQAFYTEKFQDKQQVSARKKEIREQLKMHKDDTRVACFI